MTARIARLTAVLAALVIAGSALAGCYLTGSGLTGKTWLLYAAFETVPPLEKAVPADQLGRYAIEFADDGTASITADCNMVTATYEASLGGDLTIVPGASTMAMCPEDSKGTEFVAVLSAVTSYSIVGAKMTMYVGNEGSLEFTPKP